jgi:NSS family neurotransmitter:Na+ symporter
MSLVGLLFGVVYVTNGGLNWLGIIDGFVNGTWGIAFLGLLECVVLGWLWRIDALRRHANSRSDWRLGKWWDYLIRLVIPVVLGTLFFWQLFDDMHAEGGFLRSPTGQWNLGNCVGMLIVVVITPLVSLAFTLCRGQGNSAAVQKTPIKAAGRGLGSLALLGSIASAVLLAISAKLNVNTELTGLVSLIIAFGSLAVANFALDKYNSSTSRASWLIGWAGIIAAMDISAYIALKLIALTQNIKGREKETIIHEGLSAVSYIILAVVFLLIIGGLCWCFYRALSAAGPAAEEQSPDEVGDETASG